MSQPTSYRPISLIDGYQPDHPLVEALLYVDYPADWLPEVESVWGQARSEQALQHHAKVLMGSEHSHWDWRNKQQTVETGHHRIVAIEAKREGEPEGLMAVLRVPRRARLSPGLVLYVDYLESAPWNIRTAASAPRYLGVGTQLIAEAVRLSIEAGMNGAIGLHSLPQAEIFYADKLRMTSLGYDPDYYDLQYFEFDAPAARSWLDSMGGAP